MTVGSTAVAKEADMITLAQKAGRDVASAAGIGRLQKEEKVAV
jgi:hypothetical protein